MARSADDFSGNGLRKELASVFRDVGVSALQGRGSAGLTGCGRIEVWRESLGRLALCGIMERRGAEGFIRVGGLDVS